VHNGTQGVIVASDCIKTLSHIFGLVADYNVITSFDACWLMGTAVVQHPILQMKVPILSCDNISPKYGTGIVHVAPSCCEEVCIYRNCCCWWWWVVDGGVDVVLLLM